MTPDFCFGGWTGHMGRGRPGVWEREQVSSHGCAKAAGVAVGTQLEHFHCIQGSGPPGSAWVGSPVGQELWPWVSMSGSTPEQLRVGDRGDGFR